MTTYHHSTINGQRVFYRQAGPEHAPVIVLLHGFPSSSHMFRDLIPQLAERFRVVAPDYVGFGYSAHPSGKEFAYTFDHLTEIVQRLLFDELGLKRFAIYVQDYGAPVGFRIAARNPEAITALIIQNGNAYVEGISPAFEPIKAFWESRNAETEKPVRALLTAESTRFQYTHGTRDASKVSPDSYTFDQLFLDRPGNDAVQLELFYDYRNNVALYPEWHAYFKKHQPPALVVWGQTDPFFTVEGAKAFLRDLPKAEVHLLDSGHFALEDHCEAIAGHIRRFLGQAKKDSGPSTNPRRALSAS